MYHQVDAPHDHQPCQVSWLDSPSLCAVGHAVQQGNDPSVIDTFWDAFSLSIRVAKQRAGEFAEIACMLDACGRVGSVPLHVTSSCECDVQDASGTQLSGTLCSLELWRPDALCTTCAVFAIQPGRVSVSNNGARSPVGSLTHRSRLLVRGRL